MNRHDVTYYMPMVYKICHCLYLFYTNTMRNETKTQTKKEGKAKMKIIKVYQNEYSIKELSIKEKIDYTNGKIEFGISEFDSIMIEFKKEIQKANNK